MGSARSTSGTRGALGIALAGLVVLSVVLVARGRLFSDAGESTVPSPPGAPSAAVTPSAAPASAPPSASPSAAAPISLPLGLTNKTWVTLNSVGYGGPYVAGTLDGRYHLTLPIGEIGLTAADFRVVSVVAGAQAPDGSIQGSTLIVRDLRQDGAKVLELSTPEPVTPGYAVLAVDTLYFAGNSAPDGVPGVYAASLLDGSVRTLIAPGPVPDSLSASAGPIALALQVGPSAAGRGPLVLSPSGRTLGSGVCGNGRCNVQLVDLPSGRVSQPLTGVPFGLWLLSETTLIGVDETSVYAYDVSGSLRWALKDKRPQSPGYLTSDGGQLIVLYQDVDPGADAVVVLAAVDVSSGAQRVLQRWGRNEAPPLLWAPVSTDEIAVLIPNGLTPEAALDAGGGSFHVDLLDLQTGASSPGALVVSSR